jgi:peptidoglycan/xylan/chitin deacetylase (PgdA/CDA1 family)
MHYPETLPLADKEVVLTFDDGPLPPHSNKILDILTMECVKATFFIIGRMARQFPDVVRREYAAGYTIGAHSQNHPLRFQKLSADHLHHEIDGGIASVRAALGDPKHLAPFFRVPGLNRTDEIAKLIQNAVQFGRDRFSLLEQLLVPLFHHYRFSLLSLVRLLHRFGQRALRRSAESGRRSHSRSA